MIILIIYWSISQFYWWCGNRNFSHYYTNFLILIGLSFWFLSSSNFYNIIISLFVIMKYYLPERINSCTFILFLLQTVILTHNANMIHITSTILLTVPATTCTILLSLVLLPIKYIIINNYECILLRLHQLL